MGSIRGGLNAPGFKIDSNAGLNLYLCRFSMMQFIELLLSRLRLGFQVSSSTL